MLPNHNPAGMSELKLLIMKSFLIVETVKEASAVCRSFLDGVVIFSFYGYSEVLNWIRAPDVIRLNPELIRIPWLKIRVYSADLSFISADL